MPTHSRARSNKKKRVSFDLPIEMHKHMKAVLACADIRMNHFLKDALKKSLKELEEKLDEEAYDQGKKEIKAHGTISLEEMDKRLRCTK